MSPRSPEEIVKDYYSCLQQACQTGVLNPAKLHFADDIIIVDPKKRYEGKPTVIKMYQDFLLPNVQRIVIQQQFTDKSSVCTIIDCITKNPHETISTVEWHKVKNGVIYEIHLFYDTEKWSKSA
jgi:hypothetical protein